ncbi:hypothetical protein [uncultured Hymenobacter sp.]|uniref:hypothetical protein n=1 Tax=uncultured Hymenobacter sp. TaxID=170016 RepID=UPI0035CC34C4
MQKTYLLFFCLLCVSPTFAQFSRSIAEMNRDKPLEMQRLKSQPLLVILPQEEPKMLKRFAKDPAQLQAYKESIATVNGALQRMAGKAWTLSPSVEFITPEQLETLKATNTGQLNVLEFEKEQVTVLPTTMKYAGYSKGYLGFQLKVIVKQIEFTLHKEPVGGETLYDSDVAYCIKRAANVAQEKGAVFENKEKVKALTVIACRDARTADLTDAQIKAIFPLACKFVSREEFELAVREASPTNAFLRLCWAGGGLFAPIIFTMPEANFVCLGKFRNSFDAPYLTEKDMKSFAKDISR